MLLRGEVVHTCSVRQSPIEEREEAQRGASAMTTCSPTRDRDPAPVTAQHTRAREEPRQSTALSPYKSNLEGSILSLDNAVTRAINTSRGAKAYTNEISNTTGQQLIDDIEMQQDKVRHWLEMEKDRLLGPSQRSGEAHASLLDSFLRVNDTHEPPPSQSVTLNSIQPL